MSVRVLTYVLQHSGQKGNELLTLIVLADHANESGLSWPSMDRLAKLIRADERTARRCIRRLEQSGELKVRRGDGKGGTNLYWIQMPENLDLFNDDPTVNLPGGKLPPDTYDPTPRSRRSAPPDTAVSPEPSRTVIRTTTMGGGGTPSPVSLAFQAYQAGIKRRYNAEYPASAKANGQLANVVGRVGKDRVVDVVNHYLGHADPFYARTKHSLDYLVRDCEKFTLELQVSQAGGPAPTKAEVGIEFQDGQRKMLADDYPPGDPRELARRCFRSYSSHGAMRTARRIYVRQGREQRVYAIEDLA